MLESSSLALSSLARLRPRAPGCRESATTITRAAAPPPARPGRRDLEDRRGRRDERARTPVATARLPSHSPSRLTAAPDQLGLQPRFLGVTGFIINDSLSGPRGPRRQGCATSRSTVRQHTGLDGIRLDLGAALSVETCASITSPATASARRRAQPGADRAGHNHLGRAGDGIELRVPTPLTTL